MCDTLTAREQLRRHLLVGLPAVEAHGDAVAAQPDDVREEEQQQRQQRGAEYATQALAHAGARRGLPAQVPGPLGRHIVQQQLRGPLLARRGVTVQRGSAGRRQAVQLELILELRPATSRMARRHIDHRHVRLMHVRNGRQNRLVSFVSTFDHASARSGTDLRGPKLLAVSATRKEASHATASTQTQSTQSDSELLEFAVWPSEKATR